MVGVVQRSYLRAALASVASQSAGDSMAVTQTLNASLLNDVLSDGRPRIQLHTSSKASCKEGSFVVRPHRSKVARADNFVYVPYPEDVDEPAGEQNADTSSNAGACNQFDSVELECPPCWHTVLDVEYIVRWREFGPPSDEHVQEAAVDEQQPPSTSLDELAAFRAVQDALASQSERDNWEEHAPPAMQRPLREYRILLGVMRDVTPVSEGGLETAYCDGCNGARARIPDLLVPGRTTYKYAVWLSQAETALITAVSSSGAPTAFLPPGKLSSNG